MGRATSGLSPGRAAGAFWSPGLPEAPVRGGRLPGGAWVLLRHRGSSDAPLFAHSAVPKDKDRQCFKLRQGVDKKIVIYVQQTTNKELAIERSPGACPACPCALPRGLGGGGAAGATACLQGLEVQEGNAGGRGGGRATAAAAFLAPRGWDRPPVCHGQLRSRRLALGAEEGGEAAEGLADLVVAPPLEGQRGLSSPHSPAPVISSEFSSCNLCCVSAHPNCPQSLQFFIRGGGLQVQ